MLQRNRRFKTELCVRLCDYSKLVKLRSQQYEKSEVCRFILLTPMVFIQRQTLKDLQLDVPGKFENVKTWQFHVVVLQTTSNQSLIMIKLHA